MKSFCCREQPDLSCAGHPLFDGIVMAGGVDMLSIGQHGDRVDPASVAMKRAHELWKQPSQVSMVMRSDGRQDECRGWRGECRTWVRNETAQQHVLFHSTQPNEARM